MAPFVEVRHPPESKDEPSGMRSSISTDEENYSTPIVIPWGTTTDMNFQTTRTPGPPGLGASATPTPGSTSPLEPSTTLASTSSTIPLSQSEDSSTPSGATDPAIQSTWPPPFSSDRPPWVDSKSAHGQDKIPTSTIMPAVMIPLAFLAVAGAFLFVCFRRRKRRRTQAGILPQMKTINTNRSAPPTIHAHYAAPPSEPAPSSPRPSPPAQPVLLSSVIPMSSYYNTGIDTSDAISLASANNEPQRNISETMYAETMEEPPPPYRPRSVPPASRQSSVRNPASHQTTLPATLSETHLMAHNLEDQSMRTEDPRSPFADPVDGDGVSIISGDEQQERMSAVSDLSYQADPPPAHDRS